MVSNKLTGLDLAVIVLKERHLPHSAFIGTEDKPLFVCETGCGVFVLIKESVL